MKIFSLPIVITILLFQSVTYSQNSGFYEDTFINLGIMSTVHYYNPNRLGHTGPFTLIICLPDLNQSPSNMRNIIYNAVQGKNLNAIVACPDVNNIQNISQLTNLFQFILHDAIMFENADTNKIIISGLSHGGRFAFIYGLINIDIYAGIIGISPIIKKDDITLEMWDNVDDQKIAVIMGDYDDAYNNTCDFMEEVDNKGGNYLFLEKEGVGNNDPNYLLSDEFYTDFKQCLDFIFGFTSVDELCNTDKNQYISISPNPTSESIHINCQKIKSQITSIRIIDINGKTVFEINENSQLSRRSISLELLNQTPGLYNVIIYTKDKIYSNNFLKY